MKKIQIINKSKTGKQEVKVKIINKKMTSTEFNKIKNNKNTIILK